MLLVRNERVRKNLKAASSDCLAPKQRPPTEEGATVVEFALISFSLFLFLTFILDAAVAMFHYALLSHAVTFVTRRVAVDVEGGTTRAALATAAPARVGNYITSTFGLDATSYNFTTTTIPGPNGRCQVAIVGTRSHNCISCFAIGGVLTLTTKSSALIEDECFAGTC